LDDSEDLVGVYSGLIEFR